MKFGRAMLIDSLLAVTGGGYVNLCAGAAMPGGVTAYCIGGLHSLTVLLAVLWCVYSRTIRDDRFWAQHAFAAAGLRCSYFGHLLRDWPVSGVGGGRRLSGVIGGCALLRHQGDADPVQTLYARSVWGLGLG